MNYLRALAATVVICGLGFTAWAIAMLITTCVPYGGAALILFAALVVFCVTHALLEDDWS